MNYDRNRSNIAAMRATYESRVGPILGFGVHAGGCPACGFDQQQIVYCEGSHKLSEQPPDACPIGGEHLHVLCGRCKWEHLTKLRNDPTNQVLENGSGSLMDSFARAALAAVLGLMDTPYVVSKADVERHQQASTQVLATLDGEMLTLSLAPKAVPIA